MSKKTRKKSPKPASRKAARGQAAKSAKTKPSQDACGRPRASSGTNATRKTVNAAGKESHKAAIETVKVRSATRPRAAEKP